MRRRRVERRRDGTYRITLAEPEREAIVGWLGELRSSLVSGTSPDGDVAEPLRSLFPLAHPDDPEAEGEYRALMRDDLLRRRLDSIDVVEESLGAPTIDEETADTWMTVLNDLRLVLGRVLGIEHDSADVDVEPDDPLLPSWVAYDFLSMLVDELTRARLGAM